MDFKHFLRLKSGYIMIMIIYYSLWINSDLI
jgi:hypothetical protein